MKIHLDAIGCRLNQAEIEQMAQQFRAQGYTLTAEAAGADLVVINTCAVTTETAADSRLRSRIEHGYRFDQEQGLDVEALRVHTLERMRRIFALVLIAAQFVFSLAKRWPPKAVLWLRKPGSKFGLKTDRDGPYILLRGLSAVWQSAATLSWLAIQPFPRHLFGDT